MIMVRLTENGKPNKEYGPYGMQKIVEKLTQFENLEEAKEKGFYFKVDEGKFKYYAPYEITCVTINYIQIGEDNFDYGYTEERFYPHDYGIKWALTEEELK